jgi:diamine N-acetyltransferase
LRPPRLDDVDGLFERRSAPEVIEYPSWVLPFTREKAQQLIEGVVAMEGPVSDEWWMLIITDAETGEVYGDLALHLLSEGRTAEIGYTLAPEFWGKGYAVEAAAALVEYFFDTLGVTRVMGITHPDNRASAMVLERIGMLSEGRTRLSYWVGDVASDDVIYGMTRPDWEAWRDRPRQRPETVRLVEVSNSNFGDVYSLETHRSQRSFVAPMPKSLSQALVAPSDPDPTTPWFRAIEADGVTTGFAMVALPNERNPEPFLWRLLIDRMHQRRGIASMALDLVDSEMRAMGYSTFATSWIPGKGSPEGFYRGRGFEPTGEIEHGEIIGRKQL